MTSNLPAERSDASLAALIGVQASLFDDDPRRMLVLDDGEFAALVADVRRHGDSVFSGIRKVVGLLAWAAWHRYDEKRYRNFVADFAQRLGVEPRVVVDWRRKATKEGDLPMPTMAKARSEARKSAGQTPGNTSGRIISAASTEVQAKSSEGGEQDGETRPAPSGQPLSGKSSEGTAKAVRPSRPVPSGAAARPGSPVPSDPSEPCCGFGDHSPGPCACPDHEATALHPFGGNPPKAPERHPSDRQLTAAVYASMREVDPTDAGPLTTPEEATFLRQWAQRTLDAWKAIYAPPASAEKPQRRQGTITVPAERLNGTAGRPSTRVTIPTIPAPKLAKRHADDCSCLSCVSPKAAAK